MPYHIYIPWLRNNFFTKISNPKILEIGVDVGQTMLPIIQNFTASNLPFDYTGLDVRRDENLMEILQHFICAAHHVIKYQIVNSLDWLPECVAKGNEQFDIILIDGDHNYKTVKEELNYLPKLLKRNGVAICDDYQNSRWSNNDLYYSTRESHEGIDIATKAENSEKRGVKAAVDDFIAKHVDWSIEKIIPNSEAVVIRRI